MKSDIPVLSANSTEKYGFYDRLKAEFPSQINVDLTEVCNLACIHCPHPIFKTTAHYGARYLDPELNAKMVDEVRQYGKGYTQYIRYSGEGEPLIPQRLRHDRICCARIGRVRNDYHERYDHERKAHA